MRGTGDGTARSESCGVLAIGGSGGPFTPQAAIKPRASDSPAITHSVRVFMIRTLA